MRTLIPIFLIIAITLSGCRTISKEDLAAVERGEKAMVVSTCNAFTPPSGWIIKDYDPVQCRTDWYTTEGQSKGRIQTLALFGDTIQKINIDIIQPGHYFLSSFWAYNHGYSSDISIRYSADGLYGVDWYIATFEANGGDVLYIGDMVFNLRDSVIIAKAISIQDNNNVVAAKKVLEKAYSSKFSDKLRTQLIRLSPDVIKAKTMVNSINANFKE